MKREYWGKLAFTSILGVVLSYAFVFLAALPIRYLRLIFGRRVFLITTLGSFGVLAAFGLWQWALIYLSLCLLIGSYRELEEMRFSVFLASAMAIFATAFANFAFLFSYTRFKGIGFQSLLTNKAAPFIEQLKEMPRFNEMNPETFVWYLPSGIIITMMVVLFISLTVARAPFNPVHQMKMRMFRLPDWAIWVFIGSLAGTFIPQQESLLSLVSMNLLAITMGAYFFHGLAVFTYFLDRLRIFGFWRLLAYFLVFFQMFIFVSALGVLDYWFDFRTKTGTKLKSNN